MKLKTSDQLIEDVLERIKKDLEAGESEGIEELLAYLPKKYLIGFLSEEDWGKYTLKPEKLYEVENEPVCQDQESIWCRSYFNPKSAIKNKRNKKK